MLKRLGALALAALLSCAWASAALAQVPYTFANQGGYVPAAQLDANFNYVNTANLSLPTYSFVKQCGAPTDGVTDATPFLQSCAAMNGGAPKRILFDAGYTFALNFVDNYPGVLFEGSGWGPNNNRQGPPTTTQLIPKNYALPVWTFANDTQEVEGSTLQNVVINCSGSATPGVIGLEFLNGSIRNHLHNSKIIDCSQIGLGFIGVQTYPVTGTHYIAVQNTVDDVMIQNPSNNTTAVAVAMLDQYNTGSFFNNDNHLCNINVEAANGVALWVWGAQNWVCNWKSDSGSGSVLFDFALNGSVQYPSLGCANLGLDAAGSSTNIVEMRGFVSGNGSDYTQFGSGHFPSACRTNGGTEDGYQFAVGEGFGSNTGVGTYVPGYGYATLMGTIAANTNALTITTPLTVTATGCVLTSGQTTVTGCTIPASAGVYNGTPLSGGADVAAGTKIAGYNVATGAFSLSVPAAGSSGGGGEALTAAVENYITGGTWLIIRSPTGTEQAQVLSISGAAVTLKANVTNACAAACVIEAGQSVVSQIDQYNGGAINLNDAPDRHYLYPESLRPAIYSSPGDGAVAPWSEKGIIDEVKQGEYRSILQPTQVDLVASSVTWSGTLLTLTTSGTPNIAALDAINLRGSTTGGINSDDTQNSYEACPDPNSTSSACQTAPAPTQTTTYLCCAQTTGSGTAGGTIKYTVVKRIYEHNGVLTLPDLVTAPVGAPPGSLYVVGGITQANGGAIATLNNSPQTAAQVVVLPSQTGTHFTNVAAAAEVDFILPVATPNLDYWFFVTDPQTIKVFPLSNASIYAGAYLSTTNIASGTYNSGTGLVTLTLTGTPSPAIAPGQVVVIAAVTGTGVSFVNGTFTAGSGTTGTTLTYTTSTGQTISITPSVGTASAAAQTSQVGTSFSSCLLTPFSTSFSGCGGSWTGCAGSWLNLGVSGFDVPLGTTLVSCNGSGSGVLSLPFTPPTTTISSVAYNSGTGVVTLTLSGSPSPPISSGNIVVVSGVTGTGANLVNGTFTAGSGTTGATVNYTIATGQSVSITPATGAAAFGGAHTLNLATNNVSQNTVGCLLHLYATGGGTGGVGQWTSQQNCTWSMN